MSWLDPFRWTTNRRCSTQCFFFHNCEFRRALPLKCGWSCERFRDRTCRQLSGYQGRLDDLPIPWLNWDCEDLDPNAASRFRTEGGYHCPFPAFSSLPRELRQRAHAGDGEALSVILVAFAIKANTITHRVKRGRLGHLRERLKARHIEDWPCAATAWVLEYLDRRRATRLIQPPLEQKEWDRLFWRALEESARKLLAGPENEQGERLLAEAERRWPGAGNLDLGWRSTGITWSFKRSRPWCKRCGGRKRVANPFKDGPETVPCPTCTGPWKPFRGKAQTAGIVRAWPLPVWLAMIKGKTLDELYPELSQEELARLRQGPCYMNVPQAPPPGQLWQDNPLILKPAPEVKTIATRKGELKPLPSSPPRQVNLWAGRRLEWLAREALKRCQGVKYLPTTTQVLQYPEEVLNAICKLGPAQARSVLCCVIGDYKTTALDQELGLDAGTTARTLRRAKQKLRELLDPENYARLFGADSFEREKPDMLAKVPVGSP